MNYYANQFAHNTNPFYGLGQQSTGLNSVNGMNYGHGIPMTSSQQPYWSSQTQQTLTPVELLAGFARLETQLLALGEIIRADIIRRAQTEVQYGVVNAAHGFTMGGLNRLNQNLGGTEFSPIRLREMDSHIFWELALPQLTIGDVEVEVVGNRIICRTKVPVAYGWSMSQSLPRGFEFFQLPDGRIEYAWTCPVVFNTKEVEATFREGLLVISLRKVETAAGRHPIKVAKESATRRASGDMVS